MSVWMITGANRGLGLEIARAALAEGHDVAAMVRSPASLPADLTGDAHVLPVALDVTDPARVAPAVAEVVDRFGRVDVLVNNAGRGLLGPLEETTDADVRALFDLNVLAVVTLTRAVLPVMRAQRSGRLVAIGSRSGLGHNAGSSIYDASKHALEGLYGALALEVAPLGLQAMIVEPGVFRTDFLDASSVVQTREHIDDYEDGPAGRAHREWIATHNHAQLGDPAKGARLIVAAVGAEAMPLRLPLGIDAVETIEHRAAADLERLAPWRERSIATAHD